MYQIYESENGSQPTLVFGGALFRLEDAIKIVHGDIWLEYASSPFNYEGRNLYLACQPWKCRPDGIVLVEYLEPDVTSRIQLQPPRRVELNAGNVYAKNVLTEHVPFLFISEAIAQASLAPGGAPRLWCYIKSKDRCDVAVARVTSASNAGGTGDWRIDSLEGDASSVVSDGVVDRNSLLQVLLEQCNRTNCVEDALRRLLEDWTVPLYAIGKAKYSNGIPKVVLVERNTERSGNATPELVAVGEDGAMQDLNIVNLDSNGFGQHHINTPLLSPSKELGWSSDMEVKAALLDSLAGDSSNATSARRPPIYIRTSVEGQHIVAVQRFENATVLQSAILTKVKGDSVACVRKLDWPALRKMLEAARESGDLDAQKSSKLLDEKEPSWPEAVANFLVGNDGPVEALSLFPPPGAPNTTCNKVSP